MRLGPLGGLGQFLLALAVFLLLPITNVFLFTSPGYVAHQYARPGFPPAERYQAQERLLLGQETVRHLYEADGVRALRDMRRGDEAVYNEREVEHLADVKVVLDGLRWVWRLAGLLFLGALGVALFRPAWRWPVARSIFRGSAALLAVLGGILVSAVLSFDWFFVRFHQVFFPEGTWMFDYQDSLIQFYPLEFWMDTTWKLGAATVLGGLILGGLAYAYLGRGGKTR